MRQTQSKKWPSEGLALYLAGVLLLLACNRQDAGDVTVAEQLLSIEQQESLSQLYQKGLSQAEEQRLKELNKELQSLARSIQQPLLERARYAGRNRAIALIFMKHGMYLEARQYLDQAVDHEGGNAALFYYRGLCSGWLMKNSIQQQQRQEYLTQAVWDYQRSLELQPDYTDSLYGLAVLRLFEQQDFDAAAELLDRYIAVRKISKKATPSGKARTLRQAKRRAAEQGRNAASQDVNALLLRAQAAYGLGRLNEAASFYDWVSTISAKLRQQATELKNQVLQQNNYRSDLP